MLPLNPRCWSRRTRLQLLYLICAAAAVAVAFAPRQPIGPHYHEFADRRAFWSIPNTLDVLSNLPFCIIGIWALVWLFSGRSRDVFLDQRERIPWVVFFAGVLLTGFGSLWYHLSPSDDRLPWDLLPMTCSFLSIVAAMAMERISVRGGLIALLPLLLVGMGSVAYWSFTGDYKFYLMVQFFSPVVLVLTVGLFPRRYTGLNYLATAFGFYLAAKIFEIFDNGIFNAGHLVSGHSLKHATAGVACWWILRMLQVRRFVLPEHQVAADIHEWAEV